MADALSKYVEDSLLNWLKGSAYPGTLTTVYVALYTVTPTDTSASGTEVSGGTYARKPITCSTGWSAISGGGASPEVISNAAVIDWTTTLPTCTLVAWALYDAVTTGNELFWGPLTGQPISVNAGDPTSIAIGALVLNLG
jgi:hypothetical protein